LFNLESIWVLCLPRYSFKTRRMDLLSVLGCKGLGHGTGAKWDDSITLLQILLWKPFTSRTRNTRSKWHLFCRWLWSMGQFLIINYGTLSIGKIVT
jgi:hypothetical protein